MKHEIPYSAFETIEDDEMIYDEEIMNEIEREIYNQEEN